MCITSIVLQRHETRTNQPKNLFSSLSPTSYSIYRFDFRNVRICDGDSVHNFSEYFFSSLENERFFLQRFSNALRYTFMTLLMFPNLFSFVLLRLSTDMILTHQNERRKEKEKFEHIDYPFTPFHFHLSPVAFGFYHEFSLSSHTFIVSI